MNVVCKNIKMSRGGISSTQVRARKHSNNFSPRSPVSPSPPKRKKQTRGIRDHENTHHEKWNGTGYPHGIKGEEIHIYGRITAIADVFDALGSDRCYKKAWELDKILELFRAERGEHFDTQLVDVFFACLDQLLEIRDRYRDESEPEWLI